MCLNNVDINFVVLAMNDGRKSEFMSFVVWVTRSFKILGTILMAIQDDLQGGVRDIAILKMLVLFIRYVTTCISTMEVAGTPETLQNFYCAMARACRCRHGSDVPAFC